MAIFQTDRFRITTLEFGNFKLDGGAMFGVVPRTLWGRYHPQDELNRIDMALRCLLVEVDGRKILVDTGFGEGRAARFKEIYAFTGGEDYMESGLSEIGLKKSDITDVFITHLHFDHCGGSTINKQTSPIPAFPNAVYHLQKQQLEHARSRMERDKASYFPEDFEPIIESGQAEIHEGEYELLPGFGTVICYGHTPAMQLPKIKDGGQVYLYGADLIPLSSHFPLPWIMAYDLNPITTLEEKRALLAQAVAENCTFIFEHDAKIISGKVAKTEKGFTFSE